MVSWLHPVKRAERSLDKEHEEEMFAGHLLLYFVIIQLASFNWAQIPLHIFQAIWHWLYEWGLSASAQKSQLQEQSHFHVNHGINGVLIGFKITRNTNSANVKAVNHLILIEVIPEYH